MLFRLCIIVLAFFNWKTPYFRGKHKLLSIAINLLPEKVGPTTSINGYRFNINSIEAKYQFVFGCETFTSKVIELIVKNHKIDTFLDVGANRGWFSLFVKSLDKRVEVQAFEANERIFKYLSENQALNPLITFCSKMMFVGEKKGK